MASHTDENYQFVTQVLEEFNKKELQTGWLPHVIKFLEGEQALLAAKGIDKRDLDDITALKNPVKSILLEYCVIPFLDRELFQQFCTYLPSEILKLLQELPYVRALSSDDIKEQLNIQVFEEKTNTGHYPYHQKKVRKTFNGFKYKQQWGWSETVYYFFLPPAFRLLLIEYFGVPAEAEIQGLDEIETTQFLFENSDQQFLQELSRLIAYQKQGQIKQTGKGRPVHSTVGKLLRTLKLKEFFPGTTNKVFATIRSYFLASVLLFYNEQLDKSDPVEVKTIFANFISDSHFDIVPIVLHYLKGVNYLDYRHTESFLKQIYYQLTLFPMHQWVAFDQLKLNRKYNIQDLHPVTYNIDRLYYQFKDEDYYGDKHSLDDYTYREVLTEPYYAGVFFLLASLGLVDLAYNYPENKDTLGLSYFSPYDGIKYVRLTDFGAYFFGQIDEYEPQAEFDSSNFVISTDALIITADEHNSSNDVLLSPFTVKVSPTRYLFDNKVFLKDIKTKKQFKTKVDFLKQSIGVSNLPPNWQTYLDQLLLRINALEKVSQVNVFRVPEDNTELRQIIVKDPVLKKLILKAEDFHIIILANNNSSFKKRMKELGYLLT